jgi:hypothetical protein
MVQVIHADSNYRLNLKNCCVPRTGLVTVFWPLTTTGAGELVVQTPGEPRFVVDCKMKPVALTGHVKTTLDLQGMMVSGGGSGTMLSRKTVAAKEG